MSAMGEKMEHFDYPVCSKFKPSLLNGQLCYQIDVNDINTGELTALPKLIFLLDYNDEKMMTTDIKSHLEFPNNMLEMQKNDETTHNAMIYIETLGLMHYKIYEFKISKWVSKMLEKS